MRALFTKTKSDTRRLRGWAIPAMLLSALLLIAAAPAEKPKKAPGDAFPLDKCPVTQEKLGSMGKPIIHDYKGREIRFCCQGCVPTFEKNPEKYIKAIDKEIIAQQTKVYAPTTCPVMKSKLGSMGDPYDIVWKNRLVRFCCAGCEERFRATPERYLKALDAATIEKQKPTYPLDTCVVTGDKLDDKTAINFVHANRLVRFCCQGCEKMFRADPLKYMAKIDAAAKKASAK